MILPYNSPELIAASKKTTSAAASPFVVAIIVSVRETSHQAHIIHGLPGFLNACVLLFVFSACNSDLYIASRTLHGLAIKGQAPAFIARTDKRGVPVYALMISAAFCGLAYLNVSTGSGVVFTYFVNFVSMAGLLTVSLL
jgi:amino acid transporter